MIGHRTLSVIGPNGPGPSRPHDATERPDVEQRHVVGSRE
jgi:hypothetical protein